jgi:hypothetical protein
VEEGKIVLRKEGFWEKLFDSAKGLYNPEEAELELDEGEPGCARAPTSRLSRVD